MGADQQERVGLTRRDALKAGTAVAGGVALTGGMLGRALDAMAAPASPGAGPYGPLLPPDANGVRLPAGFTSRVVAEVDQLIGPRKYKFHGLPDGMGTYRTNDGGFILVSNSELPYAPPNWVIGTGAIRFDSRFRITDAYPILENTMINCAGGVTPWGTWLSCEEINLGKVFECDPWGEKPSKALPAMGVFKHEAAVIDPVGRHAFLTEDVQDGCFYRFRPDSYPDLSNGKLDVAEVDLEGKVIWHEVPDPQPQAGAVPTRNQVPAATRFRRGEGAWYDEGVVYFATTQDNRVHAYHCADEELEVIYDGDALGEAAPLNDSDNVTVSPLSGDLFVCEDAGDLQVCIISPEGEVAPFLQLPGDEHRNSELTGPVFDPTGRRFYVASQRSTPAGRIFEINGPFRRTRPEPFPDKAGPAVKVRVLGKPSLRGLSRAGQAFRVIASDESPPMTIDARLVASLKRASGKGSREVTIGSGKVKLGSSGNSLVRIRPNERMRQRLRLQRVVRGKLIVTATDSKGNRRRIVKPVRFS